MNPLALSLGLFLAVADPPAREGIREAWLLGRFALGDAVKRSVTLSRRSAYQMYGRYEFRHALSYRPPQGGRGKLPVWIA